MRRLVPALLAASLFAAACGGGGGGEAADDTAPLEIGGSSTSAGAPQGEVDPNGTLRVSYSVGPTSFDPAKSSSSFDSVAMFLTYDRLVHLSPEAEPVPGLAESWEFSPDGTSLTLKIRPGVKFHDGADLTAEVAKANLERNKAGTGAGDLAAVSSIEAVDPATLRLTFGGAAGAFPAVLADRAGIMVSPNKLNDPALDLQPVGAGMYRVTDYRKDASITFERFADYWDPEAAKAARVEFQIIQDNVAMLNALKGDQVDWGLSLPSQVEDARSSGLEVAEYLTLNVHHIQLNRSRPFLDNAQVRQALSMAIDREGMVEGVLLGKGASSSQPFPSGYWGHDDAIAEPPYDPERAEQMLREAGVPEGQAYELIVPNTNVYPALAQAAKDQLAQVGITLNIRIVDSVQTAPIFYQQAQGDMLLSVFGGRFDPAQHFGLLYTQGPIQNPGGQTVPALTEQLAAVARPGTIEERTPAVRAASKVVSDEAVNIILHHPMGLVAYDPKVVGVQPWLIGRPEFRGMGVAAG